MMRPTTLMFRSVSVAALVLGSLAYGGAAGAAAPTCDGQTATIVGTPDADRLYGTTGPDVVWLGGATDDQDVFVDPGGDDLICQGGAGGAVIQAGPGDDVVHLSSEPSALFSEIDVYGDGGNDTVDAGAGPAEGAQVYYLMGGPGDDDLIAASVDTVRSVDSHLIGGPGDDRLTGGAGVDVLDGGSGDDEVSAGDGDDRIIGTPGSDQVDAGAGKDELEYSFWDGYTVTELGAGVTMDLATGDVTSNSGATHAVGVECWTGTPYADVIEGTPARDCVSGGHGGGKDTIHTYAGDDRVSFNSGLVDAGGGDDQVSSGPLRYSPGEPHQFTVEVHAGPGDDRLDLESHTAHAFGGSGDDTMHLGGHGSTAAGGSGRDELLFEAPVDLDARAGTATYLPHGPTFELTDFEIFVGSMSRIGDIMRGSGRDEVFQGRNGPDRIVGRGGFDIAHGGRGKDSCSAERQTSC